jgi:hypothetical protein
LRWRRWSGVTRRRMGRMVRMEIDGEGVSGEGEDQDGEDELKCADYDYPAGDGYGAAFEAEHVEWGKLSGEQPVRVGVLWSSYMSRIKVL